MRLRSIHGEISTCCYTASESSSQATAGLQLETPVFLYVCLPSSKNLFLLYEHRRSCNVMYSWLLWSTPHNNVSKYSAIDNTQYSKVFVARLRAQVRL